jgi:uncharacterized Zn-binding protein involved in type VI secretion
MGMPAARVGDMHVCPMVTGVVPHVGGPVLPPCAVTVLTGSIPQARITDLCTCVGPPDMIAMGAFTVIVSGMPAARIGDLTVHGGTIVVGLPTVLIGDNGASGGGGGGGPVTVGIGGPKAGLAGMLSTAAAQIAQDKQAEVLKAAALSGVPFVERCLT